MDYAISRRVPFPYEEAVRRVTEELQKEGFGVLTTIDVRETLKRKLGIEFRKYVILGACNPPLAHRALQAEEEVGLLLPCNVVVYEKEGTTVVAAFDPRVISSVSGNESLHVVAEEVRMKLGRVVAAL